METQVRESARWGGIEHVTRQFSAVSPLLLPQADDGGRLESMFWWLRGATVGAPKGVICSPCHGQGIFAFCTGIIVQCRTRGEG